MEKSNLMMIVIIVLLVALLGTVVGVTIYAFRMVQSIEAQADGTRGPGFDRNVRPIYPEEITHVLVGEPITSNLVSATGGHSNHIARVQVVVGYDNTRSAESEEVAQMIEDNMITIRLMAMDMIARRSAAEMTSIDGRDALRDELLTALQNDFRTPLIVSVGLYELIVH